MVGFGVGVSVAVGAAVGVAVGRSVAVGSGVGVAVGAAVGVGGGVAVGAGLQAASTRARETAMPNLRRSRRDDRFRLFMATTPRFGDLRHFRASLSKRTCLTAK
jgi:hypothetical protein